MANGSCNYKPSNIQLAVEQKVNNLKEQPMHPEQDHRVQWSQHVRPDAYIGCAER